MHLTPHSLSCNQLVRYYVRSTSVQFDLFESSASRTEEDFESLGINIANNQQINKTIKQLNNWNNQNDEVHHRRPSPSLPTATIYHHWSKLCIPSVLTLQQPSLPVYVQSTLRTFWWQIKHHITYKHLCVYLLRFYLRVLLLGPID